MGLLLPICDPICEGGVLMRNVNVKEAPDEATLNRVSTAGFVGD